MATTASTQAWLDVDTGGEVMRVSLGGRWVIDEAAQIESLIARVRPSVQPTVEFNLSALERLDTVGAWLIHRMERSFHAARVKVILAGAQKNQEILIRQVRDNDSTCEIEPPARNSLVRTVEDVGVGTVSVVTGFGALLSFIGLVLARFFGALRDPHRIRLTPLVHQMEQVGFKAVPIVALISLLIGAVIVNQGAVQLRTFGAEVFVVNMLAITQLRELGVLLTAIIIAGRSGSAFTAQIGSMVLREEVDAIRTLGLNPIDILVLPRMIALVLMLPLLTFLADLVGLLGGMLMAWSTLDISPSTFLTRLNEAATGKTFLVGLIKAPIFAMLIAISGCFEGMSVRGGAESVGQRTTASVVQSIFLVIVMDAFFAVFFTTIGW